MSKILPQVLIPYAQQWAQRSGMTLLSKLLEDENVHALVEKYGAELALRMSATTPQSANGNGDLNGSGNVHVNGNGSVHSNGNGSVHSNGNGRVPVSRNANGTGDDANARHLARLQDRLSTLEIQHELQQAVFEELCRKIRPLSLALGCCPECFAGVVGCPECGGNSRVGLYPPDETLLDEQIVRPLVLLGIQLRLGETKTAARGRQSTESSTAKTKEIKNGRGNDRECPLGK